MLFIVAAPSGAENPDAKLCERFVGASANEKAARLADFYQAIDTEPFVQPSVHLDCVAGMITRLEPLVANYCGARAQRGHGILAREMDTLRFEISSIAFDCEQEAQKPFAERIKGLIYCRDIEGYLHDSLSLVAMFKSPPRINCMRQAIPEVAARLRASCDSEPIPAPVAIQYVDILLAACPETNSNR